MLKEDITYRAADYLVTELKKHGITVMRYNAMTTSSIYLKLDDGVLNSVRISDHPGKVKYVYRYNLIKGETRRKNKKKNLEQLFFPMRDIEVLVAKVLYDRNQKLNTYGESLYKRFMKENRHANKSSKGFWTMGKYV